MDTIHPTTLISTFYVHRNKHLQKGKKYRKKAARSGKHQEQGVPIARNRGTTYELALLRSNFYN